MIEERRERADAARNRRAILRATEDLLARHRPEQISMEQVAAAAGVGKGTVFHRFGSRMGLMVALMQERAYALEEAVASGPPPLGPGAPPEERLTAFLDAIVDVVGRNKGLLAALGHAATAAPRPEWKEHGEHRGEGGDHVPDSRDDHPVYRFWHGHTSALIAERRPDLDGELLAHILLGSLQSEPVLRLLERGEAPRLAASLHVMAAGMLAAPAPS
ncbi:TetR/AcrR family transcriptional regulator [Streptosporangium sp. NBC_01756]|uniref:TetR/AcrR family transcriptional regulator n=1 Tax=Streptosporangium sp. NBC_01756 TaxID=2975950 RepID=UPI002DDC3001|nr:helix-turn-helix domain-containing protein [Streptosporangium sp. NBC_01756]WSC84547.1 TetR/AcrR family transcriptional regulator [Streptosporangium sp. NBC_01756]